MKLFKCSNCGQLLYFENNCCEKCGYKLGFEANELQLETLIDQGNGNFMINGKDNTIYNYCANYTYNVCNWIIPINNETPYCKACDLNYVIPDISKTEYKDRWTKIEKAKHRLIYALLRLKLPLVSKLKDKERGLAFDFLSDADSVSEEKIHTGHDNGLITLNITEADDVEREMARRAMAELYRTLLGHFRHEVGHYYWDILISNSDKLQEFRNLFGNEEQDYGEALKTHYQYGAPAGWNIHFISTYASSHPWEDWAETWAHYLHIIDTLEMAYAFGLSVHPGIAKRTDKVNVEMKADPYELENFKTIIDLWLPLTFSMNSLNRSMGLPDSYPFVINPEVINKLDFIHRVCLAAKSKV
jgi:hypothetical protein